MAYDALDAVAPERLARLSGARVAADAGSSVEVRAVQGLRRKHWVRDGQVRSSEYLAEPPALTVRVAGGGRDVYTTTDSLDPLVLAETVDTARRALPWGRPFRDAEPLGGGGARWDQEAAADARLAADPASALGPLLGEARDAAAKVSAELDVDLRVSEGTVLEARRRESYSASTGGTRPGSASSFERSDLDTRLLVEVRRGGRSVRVHSVAHTNRCDAIPLADTLREAGMLATALSYGALRAGGDADVPAGPTGPVLLAPRAAAALLRQVVHDLFDRGSVVRPERTLRHRLLDEPAASPGGHSRPFDHEGTPTRDSVLLDESGTPGRLVCRGAAFGGSPGTGGTGGDGDGESGVARLLTGHATIARARGVPLPLPTTVRIAPVWRDAADSGGPAGHTGLVGLALRGEGTQLHRSGAVLRFRIDVAEMRDGVVVGAPHTRFLAASSARILEACDAVRPVAAFVPWADYSTVCCWLSMDDIFEH